METVEEKKPTHYNATVITVVQHPDVLLIRVLIAHISMEIFTQRRVHALQICCPMLCNVVHIEKAGGIWTYVTPDPFLAAVGSHI